MQEHSTQLQGECTLLDLNRKNSLPVSQMTLDSENHNVYAELRSTRLARQAESFMCMSPLSVMLACYLDSGETRIIKIRIAKKILKI